jgi:hypothetical protein
MKYFTIPVGNIYNPVDSGIFIAQRLRHSPDPLGRIFIAQRLRHLPDPLGRIFIAKRLRYLPDSLGRIFIAKRLRYLPDSLGRVNTAHDKFPTFFLHIFVCFVFKNT